jgi:dolichol-phosphate hexosyltransferase
MQECASGIVIDAVSSSIDVDEVTVVVPTLNESSGLSKVLDELKEEGFLNIMVVDGYSNDGTVKVARKHGAQVVYQYGPGKTGALKTAIDLVSTPYMLVVDGDFTYASNDIQRLLNHGRKFDHIIGVRDKANISRLHRIGNWVITKTFNMLFGVGLSDVCSGMYLLKTETARQLDLSSRGFITEVEVAAQIAAEYSVTEVPISYRCRVGKGKLTAWNGFGILMAVVGLARKYNPVLLFSAVSSLAIFPAFGLLGYVAFEEIVTGVWHSGIALTGVFSLLFAFQAIAVATMSMLMKRTEHRIIRRLMENR